VLKDRVNKNRQRYKQRYGSKVKSYESLDQFYKDRKFEKEIAELQVSGKTEDVKSLEQLVQLARGEEVEHENENGTEEEDERKIFRDKEEGSDAKSGQTQSHQSNFQNKELLKGAETITEIGITPVYELSLAGLFSTTKPALVIEEVFRDTTTTEKVNEEYFETENEEDKENYVIFDQELIKKIQSQNINVKNDDIDVKSSLNFESTEEPVTFTDFTQNMESTESTTYLEENEILNTVTTPSSESSSSTTTQSTTTAVLNSDVKQPIFPNFPGSKLKSSEHLKSSEQTVLTGQTSSIPVLKEESTTRKPGRRRSQSSHRKGLIRQRRKRSTTPRSEILSSRNPLIQRTRASPLEELPRFH
jgi:hypothetical protein